jgi:hypothetical protein
VDAGTARTQQWPKPGSLVAPYLWSLGLFVAWGVSFVGLMVLSLVSRFKSAVDTGYDNAGDVALAVSMLVQALGGLGVLVTFIVLAWVKGQKDATARNRFLGYGTIALGAVTVIAVVLLFLLPDGSQAAA